MESDLYFRASERQVQEIILNAALQAIPIGENVFYNRPLNPPLDLDSIHVPAKGELRVGYIRERAICLVFERIASDIWRVKNVALKLTHQSWSRIYKTWELLLTSVPEVELVSNDISLKTAPSK